MDRSVCRVLESGWKLPQLLEPILLFGSNNKVSSTHTYALLVTLAWPSLCNIALLACACVSCEVPHNRYMLADSLSLSSLGQADVVQCAFSVCSAFKQLWHSLEVSCLWSKEYVGRTSLTL